jgi:adenosylcobyric acid synthase
MGFTNLFSGRPFLRITSRNSTLCDESEGCISEDNRVIGTYVHGFFDTPGILSKWFSLIGLTKLVTEEESMAERKEKDYDLLKAHFESHVDLGALY